MKLRPILFSTPMVQALLAGTKTQTRRKVKPQPTYTKRRYLDCAEVGTFHITEDLLPTTSQRGLVIAYVESIGVIQNMGSVSFIEKFCPIQVGDVLWVRETWTELVNPHRTKDERFVYRADCSDDAEGEEIRQEYIKAGFPYQWKPSIFMPYDACRIWLEVVSVRLEQLQEISETDAVAEGILELPRWPEAPEKPRYKYYGKRIDKSLSPLTGVFDPKFSYFSLWDSINGDASVKENPWVFVYEFKRIEKPA